MLSKSIKKIIPYRPFHRVIDETLKIPKKCWPLLYLNFIRAGGPNVGVSNERFSAKVKLRCKLDIHTALLSPPVYLRRSITVFPGGNIKISNVLKISPRFRAVPLGVRYQGIGSSDTFSVFLHQSGIARAGPKRL